MAAVARRILAQVALVAQVQRQVGEVEVLVGGLRRVALEVLVALVKSECGVSNGKICNNRRRESSYERH